MTRGGGTEEAKGKLGIFELGFVDCVEWLTVRWKQPAGIKVKADGKWQ